MKFTIEQRDAFQILGVRRQFNCTTAQSEIPKFWDEYYRQGYGDVCCGQYGYCFGSQLDGTFQYVIGNHCEKGADGVLHIFNCADRAEIPAPFELVSVPCRTWLRAECIGPIPQSIQKMCQLSGKEWPSDKYERLSDGELEEYGRCSCPADTQKSDYCCHVWFPVRRKCRIVSLREHPGMLENFLEYFASHWGKELVYRDCMSAALTAVTPLPQWFLALTPEGEIMGGAGLITNDFISRMDLYPWICAVFVEKKYRHQGLAGKIIEYVAGCAEKLEFRNIYCATDLVGFYEQYGFEYLGMGYHPWNDTSRIYVKKVK